MLAITWQQPSTNALALGNFFEMFGRAIQSEKINGDLWNRAQKVYDKYFQAQTSENLAEVEKLEVELGKADEYVRTNGDFICPEILKALDHHNAWGTPDQPTGIAMFDICRRGGAQTPCGFYMASNWWWQNPSGAWDFRCELNPSKIQATDPAAYARMEQQMTGVPENEWSIKGTSCCGSKFFPWACGASRIMEFTMNCHVQCVLCERLPEKLDNEIKLQHLQWHEACGRLTPAQIAGCVLHCVPKTNLC